MRVLIQRVVRASVSIGGEKVAQIGRGIVALVGIAKGDSPKEAQYLVDKLIALRIFPDAQGKFNFSLKEIEGELLVVSQFTLLADTWRGRRPSFTEAAPAAEAEPLFNRFVELARASGLKVETGHFQQHMLVEIYNDGPVTILLDSRGVQLNASTNQLSANY
jgi:D-tyrosyl-tRNA(Tyr) deacylase